LRAGKGGWRCSRVGAAPLPLSPGDESIKPPRIELEVVLKSQKKVPAALLRQGPMKLTGKTELGEYSIDLDKVRTITPLQ
jgi:hypothetical protein